MPDECTHHFLEFEGFFFRCGSFELLRQAEDDCDSAVLGLSENGGQEGESIGVFSTSGVGVSVVSSAPPRSPV